MDLRDLDARWPDAGDDARSGDAERRLDRGGRGASSEVLDREPPDVRDPHDVFRRALDLPRQRELRRDVAGGNFMTSGPRPAPIEQIVGEEGDMGPDPRRREGVVRVRRRSCAMGNRGCLRARRCAVHEHEDTGQGSK